MNTDSNLLRTSRVQRIISEIEVLSNTDCLSRNEAFKHLDNDAKLDSKLRFSHLVLQGGGTLGIAHLGAIHGLETAGIRFVGLAGTSAGAIVALLLCCARRRLIDPVAKSLLPVMERMPTAAFIDGPHNVRRLLGHFLAGHRLPKLDFSVAALQSYSRVQQYFGLNPGKFFYEWLDQTLSKTFDVKTIEDLNEKLKTLKGELEDRGEKIHDTTDLLKIIATALPYGLKLTFPRDFELLGQRYRKWSPALIARASMSVPLFFEPLELTLDRHQWDIWVSTRDRRWQSPRILEQLRRLHSLHFVDGGTLSNFPIDSFIEYPNVDLRNAPEQIGLLCGYPTIGISLVSSSSGTEDSSDRGTFALIKYAAQIAQAVRQQRDREAFDFARALMASIIPNGSIQICPVDTGDHNWLNFSLEVDDASDLFCRGLEGALRWLQDGGSTKNLYL
jgi:NTE family protein